MPKLIDHDSYFLYQNMVRGISAFAILAALNGYESISAQAACTAEPSLSDPSAFIYKCTDEPVGSPQIEPVTQSSSTNIVSNSTLPPVCSAPGVQCFVQEGSASAYQPAETQWAIATGQCQSPCNKTSSGKLVRYYKTAACSNSIPFGTEVYIKNEKTNSFMGPYVCDDRGDEEKAARYGFKRPWIDRAIPPDADPGLYTDKSAELIFAYKNNKTVYPVITPVPDQVIQPEVAKNLPTEIQSVPFPSGDTFIYKEFQQLPFGQFVIDEDGEVKTQIEVH